MERLAEAGVPCIPFFSNSNLDSSEEFEKRLTALRTAAQHFRMPAPLVDPYRHANWLRFVARLEPGYATAPERGRRCQACFQWSLARTAAMAARLRCAFATSLTVSPHKNSKLLLTLGGKYPHFSPWDFKKQDGFLRSIILSKELGLYRQNYCGCEFSKNPGTALS